MGWIDEGISVSDAAAREGHVVDRHGIRPCPRCGAGQRGRRDKRPPVVVRENDSRWWCHVCKTGGGARSFGKVDMRDFKPRVERLPLPLSVAEVETVWESCRPIDDGTKEGLAARGIDAAGVWVTDMARGVSRTRRAWWPFSLPLTLPMYDHSGAMRALHARKLSGPGQKGLSVRGRPVAGLLFADPRALEAMWGTPTILGVVCEGATDHLSMGCHVAARHTEEAAVWGGVSGSWSGIHPRWACEWLILTDPDPAGDKYAEQVQRVLAGAKVRRFRGDADVCDLLARGVTLVDMLKASVVLR